MKLKDACSLKEKLRQTQVALKDSTNDSDITLLTKVCIVKAMVFPVVMYGCEGWTIQMAEHQRTDASVVNCGIGEDY